MKYRMISLKLCLLIAFLMQMGCSNSSSGSPSPGVDGGKGGKIVFLISHPELADSLKVDIRRFNNSFPGIHVELEALDGYDGIVKIMMSKKDYGDVLFIPFGVSAKDFPSFFESLGSIQDYAKNDYGVEGGSYQGEVYGLPASIGFQGIVYNQEVLDQAGVCSLSKNQRDFLDAMRKIKHATKAIPFYTSYSDPRAMNGWNYYAISSGDQRDYYGSAMTGTDAPFSPGQPFYESYKLLYDLAHEGLIEKDPLTDQSEDGMQLLAQGKVGAMYLDTWNYAQVKSMTDKPEIIKFLPLTISVPLGEVPFVSADSYVGINRNSKNKEAAKVFLDWFVHQSQYSELVQGISPVQKRDLPEIFADLRPYHFIMGQPTEEGNGVSQPTKSVNDIDSDGQVGLWLPDIKQKIILSAVGSSKLSFRDIVSDLNARWKKGRRS